MIPPVQHQAAHRAGILAAEDRIDPAELLPDLLAAARRAAPALDPSGLRARLAHVMADSEAAHRRARARAALSVRRAAADALALRLPRAAVLRQADAADPASLLSQSEREAIVLAALLRQLEPRR